MAKMTIGLSNSSIDKLTGLGVMLSGAAADDIECEVYVLVNAAHVFLKNNPLNDFVSTNGQSADEFKESCEKCSTPSWIEFIEQAKEFTEIKVYICSLAGKLWGGEKKEDFIDLVDDFCGIGQYLDSAQEADLHISL